MGVAAIVGGLLLLMLPETLNRKMPDCIEDTVRICRSVSRMNEEVYIGELYVSEFCLKSLKISINRKKSLLLPSLYQDMAEQDVEDMSSETRDTASQCDVSSYHVDVNNDGVDNSGTSIGETDDKEIDTGGINNVAYVRDEENTNSAATSVT